MKARLIAVLMLGVLAATPVLAEPEPTLDAFAGMATGHGRFRSALIGLDRGFTITTRGRQAGGYFVLDQQFRFDDGETDRRVWRFRRVGPGRYAGTRKDVIGEAVVRVEGSRITMTYDVLAPRRDGSKLTLHFEDRISREGPRAIFNKATIYTLGLPVGSVETKLVRR